MLKLTKFFGLYKEFFGQEIPIRNNALMRIHITFHVNILSIPEAISFVINRIGSLSCIPFKSIFKNLVIALIDSSIEQ